MSSSLKKSSTFQLLLKSQNIVYLGIGWSVLSLLFFLLFSVPEPNQENPLWYEIGTYIFETLPFLSAAWLCYRNWTSPQIASGRHVWRGFAWGMLCFFIGNLIFGWWELYWGLDPDVSPADLFYIACYIFVGWGMFLAVLPRRLNLETWQWSTVAGIAVAGIAIAMWVSFAAPADTSAPLTISSLQEEAGRQLPGWITSTQIFLSQFSRSVNLFYVVGDVVLLIIAATLLLAFWGGRFSQSWRMIASATFALYIGDMWFKYSVTLPEGYESGLLDVFFVFSGVLFAIGAVLEFDVSKRPARGRGRRRRGG